MKTIFLHNRKNRRKIPAMHLLLTTNKSIRRKNCLLLIRVIQRTLNKRNQIKRSRNQRAAIQILKVKSHPKRRENENSVLQKVRVKIRRERKRRSLKVLIVVQVQNQRQKHSKGNQLIQIQILLKMKNQVQTKIEENPHLRQIPQLLLEESHDLLLQVRQIHPLAKGEEVKEVRKQLCMLMIR